MKGRFFDGMLGGFVGVFLLSLILNLTGSVEALSPGFNKDSARGGISLGGWNSIPSDKAAPQALSVTSISYQGQLKVNGQPYNGTCDIKFSIWDTLSSFLFGTTDPVMISVNNGLFTTRFDFGAPGLFSGRPRGLEPWVRCPSGAGDFTSLGIQDVSSVPYAQGLIPGSIDCGSRRRQYDKCI